MARTTYAPGERNTIKFWEDKWVHKEQQKYVSPRIYEQSKEKESLVKNHYQRGSYRVCPLNNGDYKVQEERNKLIKIIENINSQQSQRDSPRLWTKQGIYTVDSYYKIITYRGVIL